MRKKRAFLFSILLTIMVSAYSQVEEPVVKNQGKEKQKFSQRLVFGGDLGLSFGTFTYVKIAPVIGYRVTPRFVTGLGPIYIYENYKNYGLESSTYGGKVTLSYTVFMGSAREDIFGIGDLVLHAENEVINVEYFSQDIITGKYYPEYRKWIDNVLIGGGLSQPLGRRFSISIFVLWEVTGNHYYNNPIFKMGFTI